jgi:hypothetical protein
MKPAIFAPSEPLFCVTAEADWASEYCMSDFFELTESLEIRPTIFATHESAALRKALARGQAEVGLHPNFYPGTSHAADHNDTNAVIDHILGLYPEAETFRCHRFHDSSPIAIAMMKRNIRYDSNLCCCLQSGLFPLRQAFASMRFPVFWEDDVHWYNSPGDCTANPEFLDRFFTPGLKILNVHPFMITANCNSAEHYDRITQHIPVLNAATLDGVRCNGPGARSMLVAIAGEVTRRGCRFHTLKELFGMYSQTSEGSLTTR